MNNDFRVRYTTVNRRDELADVWDLEILLEDSGGNWRTARFIIGTDAYYERLTRHLKQGQYCVITPEGHPFIVTDANMRKKN